MRKFLIVMMLWAISQGMASAQGLTAYITDGEGAYTNIRNAPKGKVVDKINTGWSVVVVLDDYQNGWWKIVGTPENAGEGVEITLAPSKTGHWIHYSVVGFGTRNYGGQQLALYSSPSSKASKVYTFTEEIILHPVGVTGDWIKVKTGDGKHTGWIEKEWICPNPLTNCN